MAGIRDAVEVDNDILIINDWDRKYTSIYIYLFYSKKNKFILIYLFYSKINMFIFIFLISFLSQTCSCFYVYPFFMSVWEHFYCCFICILKVFLVWK
jgi:hypothetical protein